MATKRKRTTEIPADENSAAALDALETSATTTSRAHGILAREIERLRGKVEELSEELSESESAKTESERQWKERYERDIANRDAQIEKHRSTLAKVQATLA